MISDEEIHLLYGRTAVISRKGRFVLVHLDRPSRELVGDRTREFNPQHYFDPDCPICQLQREGGVIVFDDRSYDVDEDIVLD